jgi:hypothetical protein
MESKPVFELHKLPEGFIVTSDEDIQTNDLYYLSRTNLVHRCEEDSTELNLEKRFGTAKVIAQQDQIDFSALTEEEQKEIGWFDVEKLALRLIGIVEKDVPDWKDWITDQDFRKYEGFIKGFQKAQELLSDRRFTLEDVQLAFAKGAAYITKPYPQNVQFENEYKQSLSQKSWKVEVEVEKETLYTDDGLDYKGNLIPKLTNDKIKILKLVKNK